MKVIAKKNRELALINARNTQNENRAETIELIIPEEYENYNKKIVFITPDGAVWDVITDNKYKLTNAITKYGKVDFYIWLTKEVDGESIDFRTKTKTLNFYHNVDASDEITDEEIHGVNTVVNLLEEEIEKVDSLETELRALITDIQNKLDNGEFDGEDGYTPQKGVDYFTEHDIEEIEGDVKEDVLDEVYTKSETDTLLEGKADTTDIPDVSNFITKDVNNLTNYTLKTNTGSLIDLEINDTTYVVTLKLKNQDGTVISTDTIDLPLESVVVSGRYDNTTKKVILTLENGSEVDFSVADLVAGLQTEITSQNKLASDLVDDTNSGNKFVTTSEKQTWNNKLDEDDLTDYVKNTDYATNQTGGVVKIDSQRTGIRIGVDGTIRPAGMDYSAYKSANECFVVKSTLENVITGKQLINQTQLEESQDIQDEQIARLKATLPTTTEEGQDITLDKTAEFEFIKPPLPRGNTKQDTTTGKNLLNTSNANTTTVNGVTSYRNNGFYYLSGTNTKTDATWILPNTQNTNLPIFEIGQTYTMSFKGTLPSGIYAQLNGVKTSTGKQYSLGSVMRTVPFVTFTIDSDYSSTAQLFVGIQGATTNADCNFAIQIEKGSTATSYEPYTGGIPSPNPGYPQEITNVTGDVEVKVQNKNLFDKQNATSKSGYIKDDNGNEISNGEFSYTTSYIKVNPNTTYTLSGKLVNNNRTARTYYYDKNKNWISRSAGFGANVNVCTFTTPQNCEYIQFQYINDAFDINTIQIEKNSTSTPYTPHKSQTFTFPLGNEKLMLGDYLADDGIHHVRGQATKSGTTITLNDAKSGGAYLCNKKTSGNLVGKTLTFDEAITDALIEYELEEEVIVPYTSAQQEVYNQIKQALSYEEQTNISSNQNALFSVEAYQNTKLILKEMATAIVALGGV